MIFHHDNALSHSNLIVTEFSVKHQTFIFAQSYFFSVTFFWFQNSNFEKEKQLLKELRVITVEAYKICMGKTISD